MPKRHKKSAFERLIDLLEENGISRQQLADHLNISEPAISMWKPRKIPDKYLLPLSELLGVPPQTFVDRETKRRKQ